MIITTLTATLPRQQLTQLLLTRQSIKRPLPSTTRLRRMPLPLLPTVRIPLLTLLLQFIQHQAMPLLARTLQLPTPLPTTPPTKAVAKERAKERRDVKEERRDVVVILPTPLIPTLPTLPLLTHKPIPHQFTPHQPTMLRPTPHQPTMPQHPLTTLLLTLPSIMLLPTHPDTAAAAIKKSISINSVYSVCLSSSSSSFTISSFASLFVFLCSSYSFFLSSSFCESEVYLFPF